MMSSALCRTGFLASLFFVSCYGACKQVLCPQQPGQQISCNDCHKCLDNSSRYCFTSDHKTCQCTTKLSEMCDTEMRTGYLNYTFCHLLDDVSVPPPEVSSLDSHTVSAIVPRFFQEPPFDVHKPSFLYLMVIFDKNNATECESIGHIEAFHRNQDRCLFRIRLRMPKVDYTGHDNYYYDDRSPLESQFSKDLFSGASNVSFWSEVTIRKDERIARGNVSFATVLQSQRVQFNL